MNNHFGGRLMEHAVLRKRLNTYKTSEGRLQHVSDEVVMEVLRAWENWSGSTADLYREIVNRPINA